MSKPMNPALSFLIIILCVCAFFFFFALPWANRQQSRTNENYVRKEIEKFVKQQAEIYKANPKKDGILEYAVSLEELHKGETYSLLEGSVTDCEWGKGRADYLPYWFKVMIEQGPGAPGGAKTYVKDGRLTQGYGLIVWPKNYGNNGRLSFQVNQDGKVYSKDLGDETQELAEKWTKYDPEGWELDVPEK